MAAQQKLAGPRGASSGLHRRPLGDGRALEGCECSCGHIFQSPPHFACTACAACDGARLRESSNLTPSAMQCNNVLFLKALFCILGMAPQMAPQFSFD